MFTGIISHTTTILESKPSDDGLTITFSKPEGWSDLVLGESVATDGACLTVARIQIHEYSCYLMSETLDKTSFGVSVPSEVNVERSMQANDRFGGHFVQGHVDGVGQVVAVDKTAGYEIEIAFAPTEAELVVYKGSVALNGVSLTVAEVRESSFIIALIPYTLSHTTLGQLKVGSNVNLEFDMVGKYIANIMERRRTHANS